MVDPDPRLGELSVETDFTERLLRTACAIVVFMDRDGRLVAFNEYLRNLSGYSDDELRGCDWFETFIIEDERERVRSLYSQALEGTDVRANINPIQTKTGELRQVEWWGSTVHNDAGEVVGLVSVGQDITDKLALQAKLAQTERLADIGMMASIFAHEVGNPLNAIYLQAQLLHRKIDRPDRGPLAPKLDLILGEIHRLNALLEDFRAFRSPSELSVCHTDLSPILREVLALLDRRAHDKDVELNVQIDEPLPPIVGNASKLKQVFLNLCKNGIEAMPRGGALDLRAVAEPHGIRVEVRDQGQGIPASLDVFAPFATTKSSGMGLGLPLVRDIVDAHGGQVVYDSKPGLGTTFTVTLPRVSI